MNDIDAPELIHRRELLRRSAVLLGASLSAPAVLGVLNGCSAAPPPEGWAPRSFDQRQLAVVAEIGDIMIPPTNTPGARDVGVPAFIDTMVTEVYSVADRQHYLAGLRAFEATVRRQHGDDFLTLDIATRRRAVQEAHDAALAVSEEENEPVLMAEGADEASNAALTTEEPEERRPFILTTKELTLLGYFTSEAGATQVLQYNPLPGAYHGCLPLAEAGHGRTWAVDKSLPF